MPNADLDFGGSNTDPAVDGVMVDVSGGTQTVSPYGRSIHPNTDGTMTFKTIRGTQLTLTFKAGVPYPYTVIEVSAVGGGFTGAIMR